MRLPPPDVIASWPPPNYVDPVRRGPALLIISLIISPIAVVMTLLRFYVRAFRVKRIWWDDWLMVLAMAFCIGVTISIILSDQLYGWNVHIWDLRPDQNVQGRQSSLAVQGTFIFASGLAKASILVSYLRIAPCDSHFRRMTQVTIWLVATLIIIFFTVLWTQCIPTSAYWTDKGGPRCISEDPPLLGQTICCIMTDFLVYVLPLPTLFRLRLHLRQRIALMVVFSLGFVVVLAGCMRAYWLHYTIDESYDVTWNGWMAWIWTCVEANLGVICGNMPMLRTIFRFNSSNSNPVSYRKSAGGMPPARPEVWDSNQISGGSAGRAGGGRANDSAWSVAMWQPSATDLQPGESDGKQSGIEWQRPTAATDLESCSSGKQLEEGTPGPRG